MIAAIGIIAEERIRRAMEQGGFDGLPGRGVRCPGGQAGAGG